MAAFIANLAVVGNGTIDTIMAGQLSATDLAAVAVGSSIYISVYIGLIGRTASAIAARPPRGALGFWEVAAVALGIAALALALLAAAVSARAIKSSKKGPEIPALLH